MLAPTVVRPHPDNEPGEVTDEPKCSTCIEMYRKACEEYDRTHREVTCPGGCGRAWSIQLEHEAELCWSCAALALRDSLEPLAEDEFNYDRYAALICDLSRGHALSEAEQVWLRRAWKYRYEDRDSPRVCRIWAHHDYCDVVADNWIYEVCFHCGRAERSDLNPDSFDHSGPALRYPMASVRRSAWSESYVPIRSGTTRPTWRELKPTESECQTRRAWIDAFERSTQ
jgi:hypothetical protein